MQTEKHRRNATAEDKAVSMSQKITSFVKKDDLNVPVIRAEVAFTDYLVEHNIPIAAADHSGKLFRKILQPSIH